MQDRRRYKNPPIEEALCELRFKPGRAWDLTIPGRLQAELGGEYMGKPQEQRVVQVGLQVQGDKPSNLQLGEGLAKVQLVTGDGKRMVGVGPDVLSIHMLRPYQDPRELERSGWEEFLPRIEAALGAYWRVAEPEGVLRVGVRYVNKIVIPHKTIEMEEYFTCGFPEVSGLPDLVTNFVSRVEYSYEDAVRLVLSQGSIDGSPDHLSFLLDLDVVWEDLVAVGRDRALEIANDLRDRERAAFEAVITDKARELFDAD